MYKNPVVIITGAANGIGRATALKFAKNGFAIASVDIDLLGLNKLEKELKDIMCDYLCINGDLQDQDFLKNVIDKTIKRWGRIDVLINNAVWRSLETMRSISLENWSKTIKICLTAPAFLTKYVVENMEINSTEGVIINISSVMSQRAGGISPAYTVCKGGIESLTYELSVLYGPRGIRVVGIIPGNISTNLNADYEDENSNNISKVLINDMNIHTPLQREGSPNEIANIAYWLASKEASFITGSFIVADGGFSHNFNSYHIKKLQSSTEF